MARRKMVIPDEIQEQMRKDAKTMPYHQVAKLYGIGLNRTFYIVRSGDGVGRKSKKGSLEHKAIKEDYINGLSIKKLCNKYNYKSDHIYKVLRSQGVEFSKISNRTLAIQNDIIAGELTQSEISRKYGISRQRVSTIKKGMQNND